jgi:hypothetical protein
LFPELKVRNTTIFNSSLGIVCKYFNSKKKFLKSKSSYMMSAKYTEKILRSIPISVVDLIIKRKAVYLKDILNSIMSNKLKINNVYFYNLKNYGNVKVKKTGRIKRKIKKKVISQNRIQD